MKPKKIMQINVTSNNFSAERNFFYADERENKRFSSSFSTSYRKTYSSEGLAANLAKSWKKLQFFEVRMSLIFANSSGFDFLMA